VTRLRRGIERAQLSVVEADAKKVDYEALLSAGPAPRVLVAICLIN